MNERRVFGTDGIRGTANVHPMTPEFALRLGRAIAGVGIGPVSMTCPPIAQMPAASAVSSM